VLNNLQTMMDLEKVLRYFTKMPFEGYEKHKGADGTKQTHTPLTQL
jgi:hypothetical protein